MYLFTSEAVTMGHPDKVCDYIADSILDELLSQDPNSRSAVEVCAMTNHLFIFGEVTTTAKVNYAKIARRAISEIGYVGTKGFDAKNVKIKVLLHSQSPDIAVGVNETSEKDLGAGDQGIMFGFASDETENYMPFPISCAQSLALKLTEVRNNSTIPYLLPDGKTQVTAEYNDDGSLKRVHTVLISTQHKPLPDLSVIKDDIYREVIAKVIPSHLLDKDTIILVNPTGIFEVGGPAGDSGLTGRKIIVDTYGGMAPHGGGSFSGKDATKVDRSATYMARYIAKNIVASGLAHKCLIQVSYAIGVSDPLSININTFGTSKLSEEQLLEIINANFSLRPGDIIKKLSLRKPWFKKSSVYGAFGRDLFPWEALDKVDELKKYIIS